MEATPPNLRHGLNSFIRQRAGKAEPFRAGAAAKPQTPSYATMTSIILFLRRVWAFVARDWRLELSYRMQFFLRILLILIVVTTLFFISKIFSGFTDPRFEQWRDPLAAWLTGLAVLNYFMTGFSSLANAIRQEQVQGTLESVLMTPISLPAVIVASSAWDFVEATFFSILYFLFGWLCFDVQYRGSFLLALVFLILTT